MTSDATEKRAKDEVKLFKFNKEASEFEEIPAGSIPPEGIKKLLQDNRADSYAILQVPYIVWLYHGPETTVQTKFVSARTISKLRDDVMLGAKIMTVDEGSEPLPFKFVTKMADPADFGIEQGAAEYKPAYTGSAEDLTKIEKMSLEKVSLLLEQIPTPNGFEREVVVHDNVIYAVKNARRSFMGSEIEEIELVPLPKGARVESGTYMADDLSPRLYFENNQLLLIELLRKTAGRVKQETLFDKLDTNANS
ncbi:MAG: hypothetical protein JW839_01185 [Candidatus Lokiarchaeota archaeon]|nr:hypothetical protein [Candidatus Lokiarchaeota archaeon]